MKKELRALLLKQRNELSPELIREASTSIQQLLLGLPVFQNAHTIMIYISMGSEVITDDIIQQSLQMGKRVAIPFLREQYGIMDASEIRNPEEELVVGKFDTKVPKQEYYRPIDPKEIDLIVVPSVAYDRHGNRMGYGGGYYDRYLKNIGEHTVLIGINFSAQVVDELPARPHDMPVDIVIHENGIIHIPKQKPCP